MRSSMLWTLKPKKRMKPGLSNRVTIGFAIDRALASSCSSYARSTLDRFAFAGSVAESALASDSSRITARTGSDRSSRLVLSRLNVP